MSIAVTLLLFRNRKKVFNDLGEGGTPKPLPLGPTAAGEEGTTPTLLRAYLSPTPGAIAPLLRSTPTVLGVLAEDGGAAPPAAAVGRTPPPVFAYLNASQSINAQSMNAQSMTLVSRESPSPSSPAVARSDPRTAVIPSTFVTP